MGLDQRRLEPEILDRLDPEDERAIASRHDLHRINALMLQPAIMASLLRRHVEPRSLRLAEIGAGDGRFTLAVAKRVATHCKRVEVVMVDRVPLIAPHTQNALKALGWRVETIAADVFDWAAQAHPKVFDAIVTNLFLHHFDDDALSRLFTVLRPLAPVLVAAEPLRAGLPCVAARLLWTIGANDVTRHDAAQSVRAGFRDHELSWLWRQTGGKPLEEGRRGLFTHVFAGAA